MNRIFNRHLAIIGVCLVVGTALGDVPLRKAVECHPRGGLPNFIDSVTRGQAVRVAYLGGSITAAAGWRVQSRQWLEQHYPTATIEEIHAAIGGTGSDLGVYRLQRDVLQHAPDLLFVEFAVNDGGAPPERITKAMEGIVRQTWATNPAIDICFVYTLTDKMLPTIQQGLMPTAASTMEAIADHYQIPSIHFGVEVARQVSAGELIFKAPKPNDWTVKPEVFSTDGVHPHVETGHRLYTEVIARSWPQIAAVNGSVQPHRLPKPLREDNWEQATIVPIKESMLHGSWEKLSQDHPLANRFRRNLPELYQATQPDAELRLKFQGTAIGFFDLLGPDGGQLQITLDDQPAVTRNRIDGYCTYHRMSKLQVGGELPEATHHVRVKLADMMLDKRSILFEKNRSFFDQHPDRYTDHTWYVGAILLMGELHDDASGH